MSDTPQVQTVPGTAIDLPRPSPDQPQTTAVTVVTKFEYVKPFLSSKPLRRPNRTRPLDR